MKFNNKLTIIILISILCMVTFMVACDDDNNVDKKRDNYNPCNLQYTVNSDQKSCTITGIGDYKKGSITIPEKIDGYTVVGIGSEAFANKTIFSIALPKTIQSIGKGAFKNCYLLNNVIGLEKCDCLTTIDEEVFLGCRDLVSINLPSSIQHIKKSAFELCKKLKNITLPHAVETIGTYAFSECESLENIIVPEKVTSINEYTFYKCSKLKFIKLSNNIKYIYQEAFAYCYDLKEIELPQELEYIGAGAFIACINLTNLIIPDKVLCIVNNAFSICNSLKEITLPASLNFLGTMAFTMCINLQNIYVDESNLFYKSIDGVVVAQVNNICYLTNYPCGKTNKEYTIPDEVSYIDIQAFGFNNHLEVLNIPKTVTNLGQRIFMASPNLKTINYYGTIEEWNAIEKIGGWNDNSDFDGVSTDFTIYCTDGQISKDGTITYK